MDFCILTGLAVISASFSHYYIRRYLPASLVAAAASMGIYALGVYLIVGQLTPLFQFDCVIFTPYTFAVGILVGVPFAVGRRRNPSYLPGHCQTCGYDLTGNESGICSECGTRIEVRVGPGGTARE